MGGETKCVVYSYNCNAHKLTDTLRCDVQKKNIDLRFFPGCAAHLIRPLDSFVIALLEKEWMKSWDDDMVKLVKNKCFPDPRTGSGKVVNIENAFLLKLSSEVPYVVSKKRDKYGVLFKHKVMISCEMGHNLNRLCETSQLSSELQNIVAKYREKFNG